MWTLSPKMSTTDVLFRDMSYVQQLKPTRDKRVHEVLRQFIKIQTYTVKQRLKVCTCASHVFHLMHPLKLT